MGFRLPPLNAARGFEAAARHGSFKAAAEELHVTPSAVSHQVANLEAHLGVELFRRDGRGLTLTAAGDTYRHRIHEALGRLAQATADLRAGAGAATLNVVAAPSIACMWLMPRLNGFLQAHPDLRVRVEATAARRTLGDADVGMIYGDVADPSVHIEPLIAERMLPLLSPSLLGDAAALSGPGDLTDQVLIHAQNRLQWPAWLAARGLGDMAVRRELWVDRSSMAIDAAVKGLGVILESDFLAAEELRAGTLVPAFPSLDEPAPENAYFLVLRRNASGSGPIAAFTSWLRRQVPENHRPI